MAATAGDYSPIYHELCGEFLDTARETLDGMAALYRAAEDGSADPDPAFQTFLRSLHNLKGMGGTFGFQSLSLISHLLEDRIRWTAAAEFCKSPEILDYIVRSRPDAVVCTAELVGLSGFDMAHALLAMPSTSSIRVALVTSHGPDHPRVLALPRAASFVQVGPEMFDRLIAVFGAADAPAIL